MSTSFNRNKKTLYSEVLDIPIEHLMFLLHPRLESDCIYLSDLPLSRLLLMNDVRYPWCILVPRRYDLTEAYQLSDVDQQQLWRESGILGAAMMEAFGGDKLNIAALGNLVPQFHMHHIVRYRDDETWPNPVWGTGTPRAYDDTQRAEIQERLQAVLPEEWFI